jgi:antitoxin ParD1/3/4
MPIQNVEVTDHQVRFVQEQVGTGRYENASEVLRAGLRLLEQQSQSESQKLELLRHLVAEGFRSLDQGEGLEITSENDLRETIARIGRHAAELAPGKAE